MHALSVAAPGGARAGTRELLRELVLARQLLGWQASEGVVGASEWPATRALYEQADRGERGHAGCRGEHADGPEGR
eukprot:CAMPEP_0183361068 /NCGR_PEP_ID=MMETSP0164_2-20130417/56227_1 /TAXON_ID=221442 /ORGANISM="Coccolithus pelagicus ssp braarudi, Strain PLY182g" /LENGTH=75 /DNA_ID=CAMNT_0025535521 /DNA_START=671 /DNA_END=894 /DNA_ORIENTATION=-